MGYAYYSWESASRTNGRKLQTLQSKCLPLLPVQLDTTGSRQIHEEFGLLFFADHIRAITESFV